MNNNINYEEIQRMDWRDAIKAEGRADIVRELGGGWWLFEKNPEYGGYSGLLGWEYGYGPKHRFFVIHNPAAVVAYHAARFGYDQDKYKTFTDGRQIKWITRSFLPPIANDHAKMAIQQIGALDQHDIAELERIHNKLADLLNSGSDKHKAAMRSAKNNREALRKKWAGDKKGLKQKPTKPPMPEYVSATLNLLNGHTP